MVRVRIHISGLVQGVGFRPFVWKSASQFCCTGWVRNSAAGVECELQGDQLAIDCCLRMLREQPPPTAQIVSLSQCSIEVVADEAEFRILDSLATSQPIAFVSPDLSPCQACLDELFNPGDRRYLYPFINCTHCGPRFTIQRSVPYDRARTTMSGFAMCEDCQFEYDSPMDRRFHAQPNACPKCGPTIWYCLSPSSSAEANPSKHLTLRPPDVENGWGSNYLRHLIDTVRHDIASGKIVAIKGIGGFHLACDARQPDVLLRLRDRKRRPFKPLAVMVRDLETAATIVEFSEDESRLLLGRERPIVLLRKRDTSNLPGAVAPANPYLGVLLPYSPLHHLLLQRGDVWVMTSGNLTDEPIAYENNDALGRLMRVADAFLMHDRPIYTVCDDSVLRGSACGPIPIRRSRGYAPLPIQLPSQGPCVLAVGGELKSAICLTTGSHAVMGPHIGDMGNLETLLALERSSEHLQALYQAQPTVLVADLHPGYLSTLQAQKQASERQLPFLQVQHHHAHAASLIAEHGLSGDQPILACVFDGTGYGSDRTIWGGEVLIASGESFERVAHLKYAPLPGGDACILQPARTGLAFLYAAQIAWAHDLDCVRAFMPMELTQLRQQLDKQLNVTETSSMGRLFDAVAALIGLRQRIDYEGQAAMELESLAAPLVASAEFANCYPYRWTEDSPSQLDYAPLLQALCQDLRRETSKQLVAFKFHQTVAVAFAEILVRIRDARRVAKTAPELNYAGLTGGVFQNALLLHLLHERLTQAGFSVLTHRVVPPNDGGLALGQATIAQRRAMLSCSCS